MKTIKLITLAVIAAMTLLSCGGEISDQPANAEGFGVMETELKSKFGDHAYYTKLTIMYIENIGNAISVITTEKPESLKMGEWSLSQGTWNQQSEITLEVPTGTKAADFMFQLNDHINLSKLGELVEKSSAQLKAEKNIENPTLSIAQIKFPKNGDISEMEYYINLKPENGGTAFSFFYKLNGDFIKMNY